MRKRSFGFLASTAGILWIGLGLFCPPAEAGIGVSVSPSRFRLTRPAGQAASGTITIENSGSYAIRVTTEVTDMVSRLNEEGVSVRDEAPAGTSPHSCARWIQTSQGEGIVVPPGETGTVEFVVSPPREVTSGGYGAYLFLVAAPDQMPGTGDSKVPQAHMVTIPRLGVSVIFEVAGTIQRTGELLKLDVRPPSSQAPLRIHHEFRNTGNAEVVLTGTFHILDAQNMLAGKGSLQTIKTFPGEQGVAETIWEHTLPRGRYNLLLTFEPGPDPEGAIVREIKCEVSD